MFDCYCIYVSQKMPIIGESTMKQDQALVLDHVISAKKASSAKLGMPDLLSPYSLLEGSKDRVRTTGVRFSKTDC